MDIEVLEVGENRCAKVTTVAIIINGDKIFVGSNSVGNPQKTCPRDEAGFKTGEGYHLCKEVCNQGAHAEVDACQKAGEHAKGGTLILMGHYYCCDNCIKVMEEHGIEKVKILKDYGN
jgi:deoxycytidylate deaminase